MAMSVKVFDSLVARDFQNGAIRDEIRSSLKELERRGRPEFMSKMQLIDRIAENLFKAMRVCDDLLTIAKEEQ